MTPTPPVDVAPEGEEAVAPEGETAPEEPWPLAPPTPQPSATPVARARPVIRISTDMVQIDAVITDKDGKGVVDLRPEDFEIFEDGRKQTVSHVHYVAAGPGKSGSNVTAPTATSEAGEPRSFVFVIDNLGLSLEGIVEGAPNDAVLRHHRPPAEGQGRHHRDERDKGGNVRTHFGPPGPFGGGGPDPSRRLEREPAWVRSPAASST